MQCRIRGPRPALFPAIARYLLVLGGLALLAPRSASQFQQEWLTQVGDPDTIGIYVGDKAIAPDGRLWVSATLVRESHYDPWNGTESAVLLRFSPDGYLEWRFEVPGTKQQYYYPSALTLDGEGCAYFAVRQGPLHTLSKLSPSGAVLWRRHLDMVASGFARFPMAVDPDGGIVVAGCTPNYHPQATDLRISRYDPDGRLDWQTTHAGPGQGFDSPQHLAIDDEGRIHLTAFSGIVKSVEPGNILLSLALDGDGALLWTSEFQFGPESVLLLQATEVRPDGTRTHALLGYRKQSNMGVQKSFVLNRTGPTGDILWTKVEPVGPKDLRWCDALSSAPWGDVIVTGYTGKKAASTWWLKALAEAYTPQGELAWASGSAAQCAGTMFLGPARFDDHGRVLLLARDCFPVELSLEILSPLGAPLAVQELDVPRISSTTLANLLVDPEGDLRLVGSASWFNLPDAGGMFAGRYSLH